MNLSERFETQRVICLSPKVIERMATLRKAGTTGVLLAGKTEAVISRLKTGEAWQPDRNLAPRTTHGEKRIRKCVKYDLGWGFRLITLLRDEILFVCFLGPHDECDRWLADNSRIKEIDFGRNAVCQVVSPKAKEKTAHLENLGAELDDLDKRLQELSDQALRRIFCGLVAARRPRNNL
jgi:hypothetical protein